MKRNTSCKFVELLYPPLQCTWLAIFRTTFSAFPTSKHVNYRIIQNHRVLDLTSHPAVNQKRRLLGVLWRGITIRGFNKSKKICARLLHEISLIILAKNCFGGLVHFNYVWAFRTSSNTFICYSEFGASRKSYSYCKMGAKASQVWNVSTSICRQA